MTDKVLFTNAVLKDFHDRIKNDITLFAKNMVQGKTDAGITADGSKIIDYLTQSMQANHIDAGIITAIASLKNDPDIVQQMSKLDQALTLSEPPAAPILNLTVDDKLKAAILPQVNNIIDWSNAINGSGTTLAAFTIPMPAKVVGTADSLFRFKRRHELKIIEDYDNMLKNYVRGPDPVEKVINNILRGKKKGGYISDYEYNSNKANYDKIKTEIGAYNHGNAKPLYNTRRRLKNTRRGRDILDKLGRVSEQGMGLYKMGQGILDLAVVAKLPTDNMSELHTSNLRIAQGTLALVEGTNTVGTFIANKLVSKLPQTAGVAVSNYATKYAPVIGGILSSAQGFASVAKNAVAAEVAGKTGNIGRQAMFGVMAALDAVGAVFDLTGAICHLIPGVGSIAGFIFSVGSTIVSLISDLIGFFTELVDTRSDDEKLTQAFQGYLDSAEFNNYLKEKADYYRIQGFDIYDMYVDADGIGITDGTVQARRARFRRYHTRLKQERKETTDYVERYAIEDMTGRAWTLTGRSGDDIIRVLTTQPYQGVKYLLGGAGNDTLYSQAVGATQLDGGEGNDILIINSPSGTKVLAYGGSGDDIITTVAQRHSLYNPATHELEEQYKNAEFFGESGNDTIEFIPGASIHGGPGQDILKIPDIDLYKKDLVSNETALSASIGHNAVDLRFLPVFRPVDTSSYYAKLTAFEGVHINNIRDYPFGVITSTDGQDKTVRMAVNNNSNIPPVSAGYAAHTNYWSRTHTRLIYTLLLENCNSTVYLNGSIINQREDLLLTIYGAGKLSSRNHLYDDDGGNYDKVILRALPDVTKRQLYSDLNNYYDSNHESNTRNNTTFIFSPFASAKANGVSNIWFRDADDTSLMPLGTGFNYINTANISNFVLLPPNTGDKYDFSNKSEVMPMITVKVATCTVTAPKKGTTFRPLLDNTLTDALANLTLNDAGTPCTLDLSGTETVTLTYSSADSKNITAVSTGYGTIHLKNISTFILNNGNSVFPPLDLGVTVICPGGSHTVTGGPAENDFLSLEGTHTFIGGTGKNNFLIRSPKTFKAGAQWKTKVSAQNDQNTLIFYDVLSLDMFTVRETSEGLEFCITTEDGIVLPVFVDTKWYAATNLPNNDFNALKEKLDSLEKRYLSINFPFAKKRNRISGTLFMEFVKNRLTRSSSRIDSKIFYSYFKPSHLTIGVNILKLDGVWGRDVDESQYLFDTIETLDQSATTNFILTAGLDSSVENEYWSVPASYKTGRFRTDLISVNVMSVLKMTVTFNNGLNTGANMVVINNDYVPVEHLKGKKLSDGSAVITVPKGDTIITFKNGLPDWLYFTREKQILSGMRLSNFFNKSQPVVTTKRIYLLGTTGQSSRSRVARDLADVSDSPQLIASSFDLHTTFPETGYSGAQFSLVPEGEGVKYDWAVSDDWLSVNDNGIITFNQKPLTTEDVTVTGTPKDETTDRLIEYTFSVYRWFEKVELSTVEMASIATIQAAASMQGKQIADIRLIVANANNNTLCSEWSSSLADTLLKTNPGKQLLVLSAGEVLQMIRIDPNNNTDVQFSPYTGSQGDAEVLAVSNIETFRSISFLEGIFDVTCDAPATAFKHSHFTLGTPDEPENYEWKCSDSRLEVNQKGRVFFTQALPSDATPVITARDKRNGLSLSYRVPSTAWFGIGSCEISQASDTLSTGNASSMLYQYQPGGRKFMFVPQKPALMGIGRLSVSTDAQLRALSATDSLYRKRLEGIYLIESDESITGTYFYEVFNR